MVQQRRFLDKILQFMGIQEEIAEEPQRQPLERQEAAKTVAAAAEPAKKDRGRLVSLPGPNRTIGQFRVSVLRPRSYDEVQQIADHLKERQPVILSLEGVDKALSRRILDFMSGTTYALDGKIHRIGEEIFLFAPVNVAIDAEEIGSWQEEEFFS